MAGALISLSLLLAIKGGGETSPFSAQAVYISGCAVNVQMLEQLIAVTK